MFRFMLRLLPPLIKYAVVLRPISTLFYILFLPYKNLRVYIYHNTIAGNIQANNHSQQRSEDNKPAVVEPIKNTLGSSSKPLFRANKVIKGAKL